MGLDPWGGRFGGHMPIGQVRRRQSEALVTWQLASWAVPIGHVLAEENEIRAEPPEAHGPKVRVAGRIMRQRTAGKALFVDVVDRSGRIQLLIGKRQVGERNWELAQQFDLGDLIGADGELGRTRTGELTIFVSDLHFLTKALDTPPDKFHGLTDPERRQRMRYLDLIHNEGVMGRFIKRTRIVRSIRETLDREGFIEVEGPTLHAVAGGAAAKPFITHHNALDIPLHLRIALELHLKRLAGGRHGAGVRVGPGLPQRRDQHAAQSRVHHARSLRSLRQLRDDDVALRAAHRRALRAIGSSLVIRWGQAQVDFTPPFARRKYDELLLQYTGVSPGDAAGMKAVAEKIGVPTAGRHPDLVKSDVFEQVVEKELTGPVFVIDYPACTCPLTSARPISRRWPSGSSCTCKGWSLPTPTRS